MKELLEARIEPGGRVRERWVADAEIGFEPVEPGWEVREWSDAMLGLFYAEVVRPYRGPCEMAIESPKKFMRLLAYGLWGEKVSKCMRDGAQLYASATGRWPGRAYIAQIPQGAEEFVEVDGVMLVQAEWALPGFIFIGG